jgi:fatty acid desaturase
VASRPAPDQPGNALDYRVLKERLERAGLLRRRPGYYSVKIGLTVAAFCMGWVALYFAGQWWWTTAAAAVLLAFLSTQVVFLGHDAGHRQISGSRRINRLVGLVAGNALTGLGFGWWVPKHNAHHAYPNQIGRDPDLGGGPVAFGSAPGISEHPDTAVAARAHLRGSHAVLLLLLQGLGLHVSSVQSVVRRRDQAAATDGLLLAGHAVLYLTFLFAVLSPLKALVFIVIHQVLFGLYLGFTFAPNHKGMPVLEQEANLPFVQRQVMTARNVVGGRFTTLVYGGLNYQIEHHLFPAMPRSNLARAQMIVKPFCFEHGLSYRQARPIASYRQAFLTG